MPFHGLLGISIQADEYAGGDASMELTMAAQEDASPWDTVDSQAEPYESLPGRAYFSQLGVVRTKPARADAPRTMSKSCSDKLALKQCTSLLSSVASLLVSPTSVYLRSLIIPELQYSESGCRRSFSAEHEGRMRPLSGVHWAGGYVFSPFRVEATTKEFAYSRREVARRTEKTASSNLAIAWSRHGLEESMIGGVRQGMKKFTMRAASAVSRIRLWSLALDTASLLGASGSVIRDVLSLPTYQDLKDSALLHGRHVVKDDVKKLALTGWVANAGDSGFDLRTHL